MWDSRLGYFRKPSLSKSLVVEHRGQEPGTWQHTHTLPCGYWTYSAGLASICVLQLCTHCLAVYSEKVTGAADEAGLA